MEAEQIFNALDSNHDGKLSREEIANMMKMKQGAGAQMPPMPQPHVQMPQIPQGKAAMQPAMQLMQQPQAQLQPCVNVPMPPQMRLQMQMQQRMTLQVQPQVTQSHAPGPQQIPLANAPRPQVEQVFNTLDSNHDGKLSREEFAHLIKIKQAAGAQTPPMPQPQVQMQQMPCANVPVRSRMQLQTQPQMRHSHAPGPQQILLPPTFHQGQVQQMPCANVPMPPLPGQAMTGAFVPSADVIWRMQQAQGQQLDEMLKQMKDLKRLFEKLLDRKASKEQAAIFANGRYGGSAVQAKPASQAVDSGDAVFTPGGGSMPAKSFGLQSGVQNATPETRASMNSLSFISNGEEKSLSKLQAYEKDGPYYVVPPVDKDDICQLM